MNEIVSENVLWRCGHVEKKNVMVSIYEGESIVVNVRRLAESLFKRLHIWEKNGGVILTNGFHFI